MVEGGAGITSGDGDTLSVLVVVPVIFLVRRTLSRFPQLIVVIPTFKSYSARAHRICLQITNVVYLEKKKAEESRAIALPVFVFAMFAVFAVLFVFVDHPHLQAALVVVTVTRILTLLLADSIINQGASPNY